MDSDSAALAAKVHFTHEPPTANETNRIWALPEQEWSKVLSRVKNQRMQTMNKMM